MRAIILTLLLSAAIVFQSSAVELPEIPKSERVLSLQEVKNFWVNKLPSPKEPSRLDRDYHKLIVSHHQQVGERHRLIQAIKAGKYDQLAKIVMLEHNITAYMLKKDNAKVTELSAELNQLTAAAQAEAEKRAEADRIERLIAATNRLAAAIENNGGFIPDDAHALADDIVPFDRIGDDHYGIVTYLHNQIGYCPQPLILHHGTYGHGHGHGHKKAKKSTPAYVHPPNSYPKGDPRGKKAKENYPYNRPSYTPPKPTFPQRPGTTPLPAKRQPSVRVTPATPRQPQVRPAPAPRQPQVRQPQVRPAR